jgi:dienelactone hydrolase
VAIKSIVRLVGVLLLASTACAQAPVSDVMLSWERGTALVPGRFLSTSPPDIAVDKPHPVVLYLHGCDGIGNTDRRWAGFLKDQGYIVIQPNSLKRDRPASCDVHSRRGGLFPDVYRLRLEELHYAREQIRRAAWADQDRIFLMGHSEGGITVSLSQRVDFRGAVISAWHCGSTGIRLPSTVPLLAIDHEGDPWFQNVPGGGCAAKFGERRNATMLTLPGVDHNTFERPAQDALVAFLQQAVR